MLQRSTSYVLKKQLGVIILGSFSLYIRCLPVKDIQQREASQDVQGIWDIASEAVEDYFGEIAPATKRHVAVLVLDAKGELRFGDLINRSAFSNGLGLCGSRSLYTLPSCLEEVVSAVWLR